VRTSTKGTFRTLNFDRKPGLTAVIEDNAFHLVPSA
jgi:hypothetical protein